VTPDELAAIREQVRGILGLETSPDGESDCLLIYDTWGKVVEGIDWSEEVDALVRLFRSTSLDLDGTEQQGADQ
jgi:hypothetical protein